MHKSPLKILVDAILTTLCPGTILAPLSIGEDRRAGMAIRTRFLGIAILLGLTACTQSPTLMGAAPSGEPEKGMEIQQWSRYHYYPGYGRDRNQSRYERRANVVCGNAYRDCISQDQKANPGAPGSLFGGTPAGQAACERAMTACYRRYGVTPSEPRVN